MASQATLSYLVIWFSSKSAKIILYSLITSWFDPAASLLLSRRFRRWVRVAVAVEGIAPPTPPLPLFPRLLLYNSSARQNDRTGLGWGTRSYKSYMDRQSRLERSESVRYGTDEEDGHLHHCSSGLHQLGTCSCDSQFLGDELRVLVRVSRIVFLVEAIGELLDEITREAMPFSLSMLPLPAPESTVNSFPLKNHKKSVMTNSSQETQQCYICLAEYEEGDKIRVLPCSHEYHMACVDKWLKEIHGICPLCRADVRVGSHLQSSQDTES